MEGRFGGRDPFLADPELGEPVIEPLAGAKTRRMMVLDRRERNFEFQ